MPFQVIKKDGFDVDGMESIHTATEFVFNDKQKAEEKCEELFGLLNISEEEKKSSWCPIRFYVNEITVV